MSRWWQLAAAAAAGILIGVLGGAVLFSGSGNRLAMVDLDRILKESRPGKSYQAKLDQRTAAIRAELAKIADAQQRLAKGEAYGRELTKLQQEYTKKVVAQSDPVIARAAKRHGVQAVFVQGTLRFARIDLTEEVLKELGR